MATDLSPRRRRTEPGEELPTFERRVDFGHWNRFAAVNDEFVPIHMDDEAGRAAGLPGALGMGNLHVSYLHAMLRNWVGSDGQVVSLEVKFRRPSLRGTVNRARGTVVSSISTGDVEVVTVDVAVVDDADEAMTSGTALVAFRP